MSGPKRFSDVLDNGTKANFSESIPGKMRFQKKRRHGYIPPSCSFVEGTEIYIYKTSVMKELCIYIYIYIYILYIYIYQRLKQKFCMERYTCFAKVADCFGWFAVLVVFYSSCSTMGYSKKKVRMWLEIYLLSWKTPSNFEVCYFTLSNLRKNKVSFLKFL